MISVAVLGRRAAAAAWSPSEEERRKALFAYLGEGVALLVWDNIPRGAVISCPSIEKALTAETYKDRILGVTETRTVPASTVHVFTGNNIAPRGDMASRSLTARLAWIGRIRKIALHSSTLIRSPGPRRTGAASCPLSTPYSSATLDSAPTIRSRPKPDLRCGGT